jgi:hypothetical protein
MYIKANPDYTLSSFLTQGKLAHKMEKMHSLCLVLTEELHFLCLFQIISECEDYQFCLTLYLCH